MMCAWALARPDAGAVTFVADYTDSPGEGFFDPILGEERRTAFEFALSIWENRIPDTDAATIDVAASFDPLGGTSTRAVLGSGGPTSFTTGFSGSQSDTAYPSALANYLAGANLNGDAPDVEIQFNSDIDGSALGSRDWYYGLNAVPANGNPDFVTVALHELTHSMGFISTANSDGSFGIDVPSHGTLPDGFDRDLVNFFGVKLVTLTPRASTFTQPVYWGGTLGVQEYNKVFGSGRPQMYTPPTFAPESSLSHLDEDTFTGAYDLMTPFLSNPVHTPDNVVRGMMADIGWQSAGPGDADMSGRVDVLDLLGVIGLLGKAYGQSGYAGAFDVNSDGVINGQDLSFIEADFGQADMLGSTPRAGSLYQPSIMSWPAHSSVDTIYATVPEPASLALLLAGIALTAIRRQMASST